MPPCRAVSICPSENPCLLQSQHVLRFMFDEGKCEKAGKLINKRWATVIAFFHTILVDHKLELNILTRLLITVKDLCDASIN